MFLKQQNSFPPPFLPPSLKLSQLPVTWLCTSILLLTTWFCRSCEHSTCLCVNSSVSLAQSSSPPHLGNYASQDLCSNINSFKAAFGSLKQARPFLSTTIHTYFLQSIFHTCIQMPFWGVGGIQLIITLNLAQFLINKRYFKSMNQRGPICIISNKG